MAGEIARQVEDLRRLATVRAALVECAIARIERTIMSLDRDKVLQHIGFVTVTFSKAELVAICETLSGE